MGMCQCNGVKRSLISNFPQTFFYQFTFDMFFHPEHHRTNIARCMETLDGDASFVLRWLRLEEIAGQGEPGSVGGYVEKDFLTA